MVWSLLLFGRFFAQRVCGFLFAGRRGDDLPAFGLQAFEFFAHLSEDDVHVVVALPRVFRANAVDFSEDFVFFHGL